MLNKKLGDFTCRQMPENCEGCPFATRDAKFCLKFSRDTKLYDGLEKNQKQMSQAIYNHIKIVLDREV